MCPVGKDGRAAGWAFNSLRKWPFPKSQRKGAAGRGQALGWSSLGCALEMNGQQNGNCVWAPNLYVAWSCGFLVPAKCCCAAGLRLLVEKAPLWLLGIQSQAPDSPSLDAAAQKQESAHPRRPTDFSPSFGLTASPHEPARGLCVCVFMCVCVRARAQGTRTNGLWAAAGPPWLPPFSGWSPPGSSLPKLCPQQLLPRKVGGRGISRNKAVMKGVSKIPSCSPQTLEERRP